MSPVILLCVLLLAFSTGSLVNIAEQPKGLPNEQALLEDLKSAMSKVSECIECPTLFSSRLAALAQVAERCWSMCLDKIAAYSDNQDFFKTTLPAFIDRLEQYPKTEPPLKYNADTIFLHVKIFFEQQFSKAFLGNLAEIREFFKDGCNAFEGLSDEFLALAVDYMRSTFSIRKLYIMMHRPDTADTQAQIENDPILKKQYLMFILSVIDIVKSLETVDVMGSYHRFSSAVKAAERTMVPANRVLLDFFTHSLLAEISSLANNARDSIVVSCHRFGFPKCADNILAGIEAITVPLYRANLGLDVVLDEQRGRGEVLWNNLVGSLLGFESVVVKPNLGTIRQVSENLSKFIDHLMDLFLRGEDELWTFGFQERLLKASALWYRALRTAELIPDVKECISCSKYTGCLRANLLLYCHITDVVDKLEDLLALDRPTREKLVEFWRETQTLEKLSTSLQALHMTTKYFPRIKKLLDATLIKESFSDVLDEQINAVQGQGINFQVGKYHQFINELPPHQEAIAELLKTFSDNLSRSIVEETIFSMVEAIFSPFKSPIYTPLSRSLRLLFKRPSQSLQPQSLPSRTARPKNKNSKKPGKKSKQNAKSRKAAAPKASVSNVQAFVRSGPQYIDIKGGPRSAEDDLKLFEESLENSWKLVVASRNREAFKSLVKQPAREVLRRFAGKPSASDEAPPTDPRDTRSDKRTVKIATFNVEWLFLFNLSTEKLEGKISWKSLKEAWQHIRDVAEAIKRISADIICLCEVQDLRILSILVELLPELDYRAYLIPSHDSLGQNVGILTRVDTLESVSKIKDELFPKNLVMHLKLDNGSGGLVDLVLTGVHMISNVNADPTERSLQRMAQAAALKQHLAVNYGVSEEVIHVVLGDFNMVDSELLSAQPAHPPEEALNFVKHEGFTLFNAMDLGNASENLPSSGVCHIFTSHPDIVTDSQIVSLDGDGASYRLERVSDHSPVVATIHLPNHN